MLNKQQSPVLIGLTTFIFLFNNTSRKKQFTISNKMQTPLKFAPFPVVNTASRQESVGFSFVYIKLITFIKTKFYMLYIPYINRNSKELYSMNIILTVGL